MSVAGIREVSLNLGRTQQIIGRPMWNLRFVLDTEDPQFNTDGWTFSETRAFDDHGPMVAIGELEKLIQSISQAIQLHASSNASKKARMFLNGMEGCRHPVDELSFSIENHRTGRVTCTRCGWSTTDTLLEEEE